MLEVIGSFQAERGETSMVSRNALQLHCGDLTDRFCSTLSRRLEQLHTINF
jgi:hypothetical protein